MVEIDPCILTELHWNIFLCITIDRINSSTKSRLRHTVFHSFLSDDNKQDAATTTSNSKHLVQVLKKVLTSSLTTIWENTYGFTEHYQCASALYLMSVMLQSDSVIFIVVSVQQDMANRWEVVSIPFTSYIYIY